MLYRLRDQSLTPRLRAAREGRRRIAGGFGVSLLLHTVILGALLLHLKQEPEPEPLPPPAPVSMVFEGGRPEGPSAAEPTPLPGANTEQKTPTPEAPAPAVPPPPPPAMTSQPPPPAPEQPQQATEVPPSVPAKPEPSEVTVPPPQPAPENRAPAQPQPPPSVKQASPKPSDFPAPMDLSLGGPPAKSGSMALGKPLLSLTLPKRGPNDPTPYSVETDADVGTDWRNALSEWVEAHAYYPTQAVELHQEGSVRILVTTLPSGRVTSVELERGSGSPWLDLALQGMFRGAKLPPLPKSAGDQPVPFHFTMHYIIVR